MQNRGGVRQPPREALVLGRQQLQAALVDERREQRDGACAGGAPGTQVRPDQNDCEDVRENIPGGIRKVRPGPGPAGGGARKLQRGTDQVRLDQMVLQRLNCSNADCNVAGSRAGGRAAARSGTVRERSERRGTFNIRSSPAAHRSQMLRLSAQQQVLIKAFLH